MKSETANDELHEQNASQG